MRKIILMDKEQNKYEKIKGLADGKVANKKRVAQQLNLSERQVSRLIQVYQTKGKAGFVHGNRGRAPVNKFPEEKKLEIIDRYQNEFCFERHAFNFSHYCQWLDEHQLASVSPQSFRNWAYKQDILSPKAHRLTKRTKKLEIKRRQKNKLEKDKAEIQITQTIPLELAHPRRPRMKYFGELIQMDASSFDWWGQGIYHLHLAIDDCTGTIVGAYFDTQETLKGYYKVFEQILKGYGIPLAFLTDNRTVFNYDSKKMPPEYDTMTQFAYACQTLGTEIKTSSVPQKKGRIERANQTFQDRLTSELLKAKIQTFEEANLFLRKFIKRHNQKYALSPENFDSVFETKISAKEINLTLATLVERTIDKGNAIKFKNKFYLPYQANGQLVTLRPKIKVLVIQALDQKLYLSDDVKTYLLKEIDSHQKVSENFDLDKPVKKERKTYIPPLSHPWKQASYNLFIQKQSYKINCNKSSAFPGR